MRYLLFTCLLCVASPLFAQEGNDLARRSDFLNQSDSMRRAYLQVRDEVQKPGGFNDRMDGLNQRLSTWVGSWNAIANLLTNPPQVGLTEMENLLAAELNKIGDNLARIEGDMIPLLNDMIHAQAQLGSLQAIPYRLAHYRIASEGQDRLELQIRELSVAIEQSYSHLSAIMADFREGVQHLRVAFSAKIASIWSQRGIAALNEVLGMADQLFLAIELLDPIERSFLQALGRYQVAYSNNRLMEAIDHGIILRKQCGSLEAEINSLPLATHHKSRAVQRLKSHCSAPLRVIDLLEANPGQYVSSAIMNRRRPRIERFCQSSESYLMNCKLFSIVAGISEEQIRQLPVENLRQIEAIYTAIETNRRRGNIF